MQITRKKSDTFCCKCTRTEQFIFFINKQNNSMWLEYTNIHINKKLQFLIISNSLNYLLLTLCQSISLYCGICILVPMDRM